jgi:hypothetical protein
VIQSWVSDRAVRIRLVILVVILGYVAVILASHFVPLPVILEGPLVLVGWLFLPGLFVWGKIRRVDMSRSAQPPAREMLRPWALTATFGALAGVALVLAIGWDVPRFCHGPVPVNCVKYYHWSVESDHYFHTIDGGLPTEISLQTYVQEVGFDLRSAAAFGVFALCLAWVGAAVLRRSSKGPDS